MQQKETRSTEIFRNVYRNRDWGEGSGPGSTPEATLEYRRFLQGFLGKHGIRRVLDIGCGDWQFSRLIDWSGIDYAGIDCVPEMVAADAQQFGSDTIRFLCGDLLSSAPPLPADLVIVKDVLQHWSDEDIWRGLTRLAAYPRVLLINCERAEPGMDRAINASIQTGDFRPLDLRAEPFRLPTITLLRFGTKRVDLWEPGRGCEGRIVDGDEDDV